MKKAVISTDCFLGLNAVHTSIYSRDVMLLDFVFFARCVSSSNCFSKFPVDRSLIFGTPVIDDTLIKRFSELIESYILDQFRGFGKHNFMSGFPIIKLGKKNSPTFILKYIPIS